MRFERLDLNLLVALDALLEERSVSTAARRLCISQPALSGALGRLREFFDDDLLVQSGRQMFLTSKAQELKEPVREVLIMVRSRITTPISFDPATAERHFTIVASDFAYNVLVASVLSKAAKIAPGISFDVEPTSTQTYDRLVRGEVDLLLTIAEHMAAEHPHVPLFSDDHVVISCASGPHAEKLTMQSFCSAPHAVVFFGQERFPAFTETYFLQHRIERKIAVRVPTFSALPQAVVGSNRLATMYRRHAEFFAEHLPIAIHEPPLPLPRVREDMQWHQLRSNDTGLSWLIALMQQQVAELGLDDPEPTDD